MVTSADDSPPPVDYLKQIRPLFQKHCYKCHGPEKQESAFRLDDKATAFNGGQSGQPAIIPGQPDESHLVRLIRGDCMDKVMPPEGERPSEKERALIIRWIKEGAPWPEEKKRERGEIRFSHAAWPSPRAPAGGETTRARGMRGRRTSSRWN
jgi:mono/diheme cytochrome c family protein